MHQTKNIILKLQSNYGVKYVYDIETAAVNVIGTDVLTHKLSISSENIGVLIKAFVTNIYTNPKKTLLTEYVQNALDN